MRNIDTLKIFYASQQPIYLIACHALPCDIQCHISCVIIVLKVPKCLFIGGSTQIFIKIVEISHRNRKNNFHATFMTLKNRNKNDIGQVSVYVDKKASAIFSTSYFNDIPFHKLCSSNEITNRIYGYQIKTEASFLEK